MQSLELERVRRHTVVSVNQRIDDAIAETIREYSHRTEGAIRPASTNWTANGTSSACSKPTPPASP